MNDKQSHDLRQINDCLLSLGNDYTSNANTLTRLAGEVLEADFAVYRALKGHTLSSVSSWNTPDNHAQTEESKGTLCSDLLFRSEENHLLVTDLPNSQYGKHDPSILKSGVLSYLGHVIKTGDTRMGVLCVAYKSNFTPPDDHLQLMKVIASAMGNVEMRREKEQLLVNSNKLLQSAMDHLKEAQEEIIKRERLSALGQMVSGIAHDFNNALMPIMGISDLILHNKDLLDDKQQVLKDMEMIHHSACLAANTVKSLREFYKPTTEEDFVAVDIGELIKRAVSSTEHAWKIRAMEEERPIEMRVVSGPIPETAGNRDALEDVLSNLILNSVDAMPDGGIITIRSWQENGHIYISVRDTGIGMADEVRSHCLEPFFTTKYSTGTGMGLSRSYGIISRHGGTMTVESAQGTGTEIIVTLLRRTPEPEKEAKPAPKAEGTPVLDILIVDDDERTRYLIEKLLSREARSLTVCASGPEALDKFNELHHSLVITDRAMPVMTGDILASRIKAISPETPIIMLTGFGDLMDEDERPEHVDLILSKPVTRQQLYEAIVNVTSR